MHIIWICGVYLDIFGKVSGYFVSYCLGRPSIKLAHRAHWCMQYVLGFEVFIWTFNFVGSTGSWVESNFWWYIIKTCKTQNNFLWSYRIQRLTSADWFGCQQKLPATLIYCLPALCWLTHKHRAAILDCQCLPKKVNFHQNRQRQRSKDKLKQSTFVQQRKGWTQRSTCWGLNAEPGSGIILAAGNTAHS